VAGWFHSKEEKAEIAAAETEYAALLAGLRGDPARLASLADDLQRTFDAGHRSTSRRTTPIGCAGR